MLDKKLLAAALKEFIAQGYGATSLNQIVRASGISKTTLYARFASKEELFRAMMREQILRGEGALTLHPRGQRLDLRAGLEAYANHMLEISLEGDLLKVNRLIHSESSRFPELGIVASDRTRLGIEQVAEFIRECAGIGPESGGNHRAAAEAFIFMIRGWYIDIMLTNRKVSVAQRRQWVKDAVAILLASSANW